MLIVMLILMLLIWLIITGLIVKPSAAWLALIILYLFSTQPVASLLIRSLDKRYPAFHPEQIQPVEPQAIVILGGGLPRLSPEMSGHRPSMYTLERLRYGAWLSRQTGLPVLVSGGGKRPEAGVMATSLKNDFGITTRWQEEQSTTTWENAVYVRDTLPEAIQSVLLVTHGWHMARAALSFEKAGFYVIPAPGMLTDASNDSFRISRWLPSARHLSDSERALREYAGYIWYWLVY
ncbi:YdcF family protein [Endozoicomonas sp. SCSIO W0465]|uniref:YdcF family protein n=1 Tax=Endozoicomonas sp. SCSIO W0465 TaxID=2918516 RepID=UPI002074E594|nr:YdcF family protein [Endozoicomonas sp. SCSIO W0465]USE39654.1 YdcF family protein [Endozoicomonas sp. SCSIO W0465]